MNPKFWLSVAFFMSRIGIFVAAGQCGNSPEQSTRGMFLRGHTFKTYKIVLSEACFFKCASEAACQSYNVVIGHDICELNNRTMEARPEDFVPDRTRYYVKRAVNRVALGSIPELPAESCSEIKASEGNEMVNGDYWIYSDGNGQTILARCEENWQKINTESVCFGTRGDQYGAFNITKSGRVKTMKLVHKSGSVECTTEDDASFWGCRHFNNYGYNGLMTIITNAERNALLPPVEDLKITGCNKKHFYHINGIAHTSPELVFSDLSNPLSVSRNQELQMWFGQDLVNCGEYNNDGTTCVDVYAWYV